MLRLNVRQRAMLVEKVPDLANLAMAGLVFGQFLGAEAFSIRVALGGVVVWITGTVFALVLAGEQL